MRRKGGAWIGWHGAADEKLKPFEHDGIRLEPVPLSALEVEEYYEGFSNGTLWPLYHDVIAPPEFHREWWDAYVDVNQRFAERASRIAKRVPPYGSRTTSCSWCRRCCEACVQTSASGSSCTSRSRPVSCSRSCPGGDRSSRVFSVRISSDSSCPAPHRTSSGSSANESATRRTAT